MLQEHLKGIMRWGLIGGLICLCTACSTTKSTDETGDSEKNADSQEVVEERAIREFDHFSYKSSKKKKSSWSWPWSRKNKTSDFDYRNSWDGFRP